MPDFLTCCQSVLWPHLEDIALVAALKVQHQLPHPVPDHHFQVVAATGQPGAALVKVQSIDTASMAFKPMLQAETLHKDSSLGHTKRALEPSSRPEGQEGLARARSGQG